MLAPTRSADTCASAWAILGSGAGPASVARSRGTEIAIHTANASIRDGIENAGATFFEVILIQGKPAGCADSSGSPVRRGFRAKQEDLTVGPGELNIIRYDLARRHSWFIVRNVKAISILKKTRSTKAKSFLVRSAAPISKLSQ